MDVIAELQHRHRELIHDLKGIQAMLANNITLNERDGWTTETRQAQTKRVMQLAVERLAQITEGG